MQKRLVGIAVLFALTVPLAAFAQDTTPEAAPGMAMTPDMMTETVAPIELPPVDPLEFDGIIVTAGSSTVYPLTERMAELFIDEGFSGQITVDSIGSGAGFERFCVAGEIDISNSSRAIKDSEIENCGALTPAREPIEFRVGTDAITLVVSQQNDFVQNLTITQVSQIFSGAITSWDQVDPSYPAQTIQVFSPGSDSGTYDYFLEATLELATDVGGLGLDAAGAEAAIQDVPGIQFSEDDNVLVQGIEGSPYALGFFGFAYYNENQGALRALSINGVLPNAETAENGDYPVARPLFIYSDAGIIASKPQVAAFISFYLSNVNDEIMDVGYFPASTRALNTAKQALLDTMAIDG